MPARPGASFQTGRRASSRPGPSRGPQGESFFDVPSSCLPALGCVFAPVCRRSGGPRGRHATRCVAFEPRVAQGVQRERWPTGREQYGQFAERRARRLVRGVTAGDVLLTELVGARERRLYASEISCKQDVMLATLTEAARLEPLRERKATWGRQGAPEGRRVLQLGRHELHHCSPGSPPRVGLPCIKSSTLALRRLT